MTTAASKRSYDEIQAEIKALEAEAQAILHEEKSAALTQARALVQRYGLTARDLGIDASGALVGEPKAPRKAVAPKYAHPTHTEQVWSGRGRKPKWVDAALAEGKTLGDLLIK